jgi:iron complex outermembrane receptor protein
VVKSEVRLIAGARGTPIRAHFLVVVLSAWALPLFAQVPVPAGGSGKSTTDDSQLQDITVTAYRITRGSVGSLVDSRIEDVPRNLQVITEEVLADEMVDSTLDILKNFAGVQRGSDSPGGEHPRVRGQYAYQFLEGTYSGNVIWDAGEFLGSAELLTGPNSIQFGFLTQGGGSLNYRLKRPVADSYVETSVRATSWGDYKYLIDANLPIGEIRGDGIRVIGLYDDVNGYQRGFERGTRDGASVALTYSGFAGIKAELDAQKLNRNSPAFSQLAFSTNPTGPIPELDPRNSTEQPWSNIDRHGDRIGGRFSRDLWGTWHAVATLSTESQDVLQKNCVLTDPDLATGEGSYNCGTFGFSQYSNRSYRLDVSGSFETFGLKHSLAIGASQLRQHLQLPGAFYNYSFDASGAPVPEYSTQNLYDPRTYPEPTAPSSETVYNQYRESIWYTQGYIQDRIKIGDHVDFWIGANEGEVKTQVLDASGLLADTTANGLSPSGSLSYSPREGMRFYATYADSISPGGTAPLDPTYVNAGERFAPLRLKSYELGFKQWWDTRAHWDLNLFDSEQPLEYTRILGPNRYEYTQTGKNEFQGVEFNSSVNLPWGLDLSAGVTLMKPLQKETGNSALDDKYVPGVSRKSATLYADYKLPYLPAFALTGDVTYDSSTPLLAVNGYDIPGHTLVDLGARYVFTAAPTLLTVRVEVQNLLDARYLSPYVSSVIPGAPRTVYISFTARFNGPK